MVLFLDPHSRKDVKSMRQKYMPGSSKSSRRLYAQALKLRKNNSTLFSGKTSVPPKLELFSWILDRKSALKGDLWFFDSFHSTHWSSAKYKHVVWRFERQDSATAV